MTIFLYMTLHVLIRIRSETQSRLALWEGHFKNIVALKSRSICMSCSILLRSNAPAVFDEIVLIRISGAVKSNIGHLEGASGVASIIKTILILENGIIPPNANFQQLNPNIDAQSLRIKVNLSRPS